LIPHGTPGYIQYASLVSSLAMIVTLYFLNANQRDVALVVSALEHA
jgi:hypothetical protein